MASQTPPKTMSSRLLTMKFMQRAAASPASPSPSTPATPQSDEQASKRRKVAAPPSASSEADISSLVDSAAVKTALEEEERKRQEAVVQRAAESGDARWVLDVPRSSATRAAPGKPSLNVVSVGFAQIDSQDAAGSESASLDGAPSDSFIQPLRRYNMDKKKVTKGKESESDDTGSESDSDSDSSEGAGRRSYGTPSAADQSRAESARQALLGKRKAEKAKAKELADKRRKKEIKLNSAGKSGGINSISSGGGVSSSPAAGGRKAPGFSCHRCGKPGHKAVDCKGSSR